MKSDIRNNIIYMYKTSVQTVEIKIEWIIASYINVEKKYFLVFLALDFLITQLCIFYNKFNYIFSELFYFSKNNSLNQDCTITIKIYQYTATMNSSNRIFYNTDMKKIKKTINYIVSITKTLNVCMPHVGVQLKVGVVI